MPSKTHVSDPERRRSSAEKNIFLRSSSMSQVCFRNVPSSVTFSLSAHVSSARPSVEYEPTRFAR